MTKKERYVEALIHLENAKALLKEDETPYSGMRILWMDVEIIQLDLCAAIAIEVLPPIYPEKKKV